MGAPEGVRTMRIHEVCRHTSPVPLNFSTKKVAAAGNSRGQLIYP